MRCATVIDMSYSLIRKFLTRDEVIITEIYGLQKEQSKERQKFNNRKKINNKL